VKMYWCVAIGGQHTPLIALDEGSRMTRQTSWLAAAATVATISIAGPLRAQDTSPLAVGDEAPDFALGGGTAEGVLPDTIRLSDFRGKTVVLAFFFKARTKG